MTPEQLKASILQRAMEGKLVPQDPTDEPASELLKRIKVEKEKLIADGKIKRDKKETELFRGADGKPYEKLADGKVKKVEVPYEIPDSWEWVRLGNIILQNIGGGTPNKGNQEYWNGDIPWASVKDLNVEFLTETQDYITKYGLENSSTNIVPKDNIIIATRMGLRKVCNNKIDVAINQDLRGLIFLNAIVSSYFMEIYPILKFSSSGTTVKGISLESLNSHLIPLPPLAEQKRIVTQIEHALKQVEIYAENYHKLQELEKAFPDKLKKSILQYAMQGKLVAQDPNDEPVKVLLEKIRAEKQKLYEEGKLKKKDLAEIVVEKGDDNSPYGKIPRNWALLSVKDIFSITTGLSYKKTDLAINQRGVRIIRGGNIEPLAYKLLDNDYYIEPKHITSESVYLKRNQLVTPVSSSLEHIGKFARIDKNYSDIVAGGFVFQLTPFISSDTLSNYLLLCLSSPLFYKQLQSVTKLSGQALYNIPKTKLNDLRIALAPEQEQERISNKVGQLFQKVNQL